MVLLFIIFMFDYFSNNNDFKKDAKMLAPAELLETAQVGEISLCAFIVSMLRNDIDSNSFSLVSFYKKLPWWPLINNY